MYNNAKKLKNIELPDNLFSNLGTSKKMNNVVGNKDGVTNNSLGSSYNLNPEMKLTNYSKRVEYRDRISKMYDDLSDISPVDGQIDDTLYFNNYLERGIVVRPKISSLKQFWTEYRLMRNEKLKNNDVDVTREKNNVEFKKLENFDDLFNALSLRVNEINNYIDELKEMRTNIDLSSIKLEEDKEKLKKKKKRFMSYKKEEEKKLKEEKDNLRVNYDRLQNIIDDLDKKLGEVTK